MNQVEQITALAREAGAQHEALSSAFEVIADAAREGAEGSEGNGEALAAAVAFGALVPAIERLGQAISDIERLAMAAGREAATGAARSG